MTADSFDLIVIGSGSAARDAAGKAAHQFGARVALIENTRWGGSCPNVACRPTKAYVVAAELMHDVRTYAAERGIDLPAPKLDLARTRIWKDSLRRDQESWQQVLADAGYDVIRGTASFVDARKVRVAERELTADKILIATGSRTAVPPIPGIDEIDWLDHISALELDLVPESLLVIGGGPVGLEFAQIFARFGSRVTIVNSGPQIAARADREAAAELQAVLEEEGIEVLLDGGVDSLARGSDGVVATIGDSTSTFSHVLLAAGRKPNVEDLELANAGVEVGRGGIVVDDHQRTNVPGIWAAGDVSAGPMLTPIAQYQARIAIDGMYGDGSKRVDYSVLPTAIFTDPELGGRRAHLGRSGRPGPRRRRRQASALICDARTVHAHEARPFQDRLRPDEPARSRRPCRVARGQRHRREPGPCAEARPHRRGPRRDAPRVSELQRRPESRGRASSTTFHERSEVLTQSPAKVRSTFAGEAEGPGRRSGPQLVLPRAVLAYGSGGSRPPGVRGQSGRRNLQFTAAVQA